MNRRSFITSMLAAAVAPMALKGAGRTWKKVESLLVPKYEFLCINPEWKNAPYEDRLIFTVNDFKNQPRMIVEAYPRRFDSNGKQIYPFVWKRNLGST